MVGVQGHRDVAGICSLRLRSFDGRRSDLEIAGISLGGIGNGHLGRLAVIEAARFSCIQQQRIEQWQWRSVCVQVVHFYWQ